MELRESQTVEFKREVTDRFCREVVAFANTEGGRIYIGVDDDGTVVGLENPDGVMCRIAGMLEADVEPDIRRYIAIREEVVEGRPLVVVDVQEGDRKPYCIARKGYVPAGVYVRVGTSCTHASHELIRSMILDSDGDSLEEQRCREQDLTFDGASKAFERAGVAFGREQMRTLGLVGRDGGYTNLGLWLSDQNPFEIRCAVYNGETPSVFLSRKEFGGSLLAQIDAVLEYFDLIDQVASGFDGCRRVDRRDYPLAALREAFLNCVAHRDYGYTGPVLLSFYPDRAQFVSLGGLLKGLTVDDIQCGASATRNRRLAEVLYRLRLVEGYGTGLQTMFASYEHTGREPIVDVAPNSFVAVLPNLNYGMPAEKGTSVGAVCVRRPVTVVERDITLRSSREDALMDLAQARPDFSRKDAEEYLCAGRDATLAVLNKLVADGRLAKCGNTRATRYCLPGEAGATALEGGTNGRSACEGSPTGRYDPSGMREIRERVARMRQEGSSGF